MSRFFPRSWHRLAAPSLVTLSFVPFAFGTSASGPVKDLQASHLQWQSAGLGSSTLESLTEQYRVFRDVSLAKGHGAAIDANGDLIQFSLPLTDKESLAKAESLQLHKTLSGGQLKQLVTTQESVVALGPSNAVYVIPKDQKSGGKIQRGFLWNTAPCDILSTKELKRGEYIQQLAAGSDFVLALSNTGRVLASATDGTLTDNHFLPSSFNASQESSKNKEKSLQLLESCKDLIVAEIACGSQHVLLRTKDGRVFGLGNNDKGQLALTMERDLRVIKAPTELQSLWSPAHNISKPIDANCTKIAAGGDISMFVIDRPDSTEVLSCGFGQFGQLGNGSVYKSLKYTHVQARPVRVKSISQLSEYSESQGKVVPIRLANLMASPTHSAAILDNATFDGGETNGVISGHDIFLWGQNGFGQLARADGKKSHLPVPSRPRSAETEEAKDENQRVRLEPLGLLKLPGSNKKVKATQTLCLGNEVSLIYNRLME